MSQTATISASLCARNASSTWSPRLPTPMKPTRTRSLAPRMRVAPSAVPTQAAAAVLPNVRRVTVVMGRLLWLLLAVCRFGQGLGLGGEWGGAVLLAIENAPPGRRAWYGMFPQLGAPLGFFCSGGVFVLLSNALTDDQFFRFGWRI